MSWGPADSGGEFDWQRTFFLKSNRKKKDRTAQEKEKKKAPKPAED